MSLLAGNENSMALKIRKPLTSLLYPSLFTLLYSLSSTASAENTLGIAQVLTQLSPQILATPGADALRDVLVQFNQITDPIILNQGLTSLAPNVDGALLYEGFINQQLQFGAIGDRMNTVQFWRKHAQNGFPVGDAITQESVWIKLLGHHAQQKERDLIAGYNNNMGGIIVGSDWTIDNTLTAGGALGWTYARIKDKVWDGSKTDIHSFNGYAYFLYNCASPWFFNTTVGMGYNDYNLYREVQFGTLHLRPTADFDGWQLGVKSEVGYVIESNQFQDVHFVPNASLYYSHMLLSSYDEIGAGTASQNIERSNFDALIGAVGVKMLRDFVMHPLLVQPELHLQVYYDFVGDKMETTSQFIGGVGPSFKTSGFEVARLGANIGAAVNAYAQNGLTISAQYDFNARADYTAHTGFVRSQYTWG